jgi:mannose/fructose/N-acetylgalactosamine-specific phosphotransferase system component IIC
MGTAMARRWQGLLFGSITLGILWSGNLELALLALGTTAFMVWEAACRV